MRNTDCLIIIDPQNDFCTGGSLAVPDAEAIFPIINQLAKEFNHIVITQDWHPKGHTSFASSHVGKVPFESIELPYGIQVLWPDHCIQGWHGSDFHIGITRAISDKVETIIRKGTNPLIDSYSAFMENDHKTPTGLGGYFKERGIDRVFLVGLAFDYCVRYSAEDAVKLGFETIVIQDACRSIASTTEEAALKSFVELGVGVLKSDEII